MLVQCANCEVLIERELSVLVDVTQKLHSNVCERKSPQELERCKMCARQIPLHLLVRTG